LSPRARRPPQETLAGCLARDPERVGYRDPTNAFREELIHDVLDPLLDDAATLRQPAQLADRFAAASTVQRRLGCRAASVDLHELLPSSLSRSLAHLARPISPGQAPP
jgi:hypothetical protein